MEMKATPFSQKTSRVLITYVIPERAFAYFSQPTLHQKSFKYLYTMRHNDYVPETVASGDFMAKQRPITMAWRLFYLFRTVFLPYYIAFPVALL